MEGSGADVHLRGINWRWSSCCGYSAAGAAVAMVAQELVLSVAWVISRWHGWKKSGFQLSRRQQEAVRSQVSNKNNNSNNQGVRQFDQRANSVFSLNLTAHNL